MKIRELTLENFGVVKGTRTYKFADSGVIGICGANGTGKTHILRALRYALFNDPGCILCYIVHDFGRDPEIQTASVTLTADVGDVSFTVTRSVTLRGDVTPEDREAAIAKYEKFSDVTSKAKLVCGEEKLGAAAKVQDRLYELTGLRDDATQDVVFVPQGQTGAVLCKTRADRVDALQKLSGVGVCAALLSEARAKGQQINIVDRSEDLDVVSSRFGILSKELDEIGTPNVEGLSAELQTISTELEDLEKRQREQQRIIPLAEELEGIQAWFETASQPVLREGLDPASEEDIEIVRDKIRKLEDNEAKKERYNVIYARHHELSCGKAELERRIQQKKENPPATSEADLAKVKSKGEKLRGYADGLRDAIKIFDETGRCPTCGSEPQGGEEALQKKRDELVQCDASLAVLREEYMACKQQWDVYNTKLQMLQQEFAQIDAEIKQLDVKLEENKYEPVAEGATDELRSKLAKMMHDRAEYDQFRRDLAVYQASKEEKAARREFLANQIKDVDMQNYAPRVEELRTQYADVRTRLDEDLSKKGKIEGIRRSFEETKAEMERLQGLQKDVEVRLAVKQYLDATVGLMHRDALPTSVARYYFRRLNVLFERYADEAGVPFRIRLDPETYEFMADFPEGSQPVSMLSGGQFTMAAWVYHLAMYEKHAAQAGLLAMDEPTNGLDKANMLRVQEVLYRVNSYCERANLQMLLVTHEEDLLPACSQVVQVS